MKNWCRLFAGAALTALVTVPAAAQWNAGNDEANRQSMMADMRASAAANDRANFDSQQRQQADSDRFNSSSGAGTSSGSYGAAGSSASSSGYSPRAPAGPQSIVSTYSFIIHRQESTPSLLARLETEAVGGNSLSAFNLGRVFYTGFDGAPRDEVKARHWFGEAARLGHPGAQAQYGQMMYYGIGGSTDQATALTWLQAAADHNDSYGMALYGVFTLLTQMKANPDAPMPQIVAILVKAADAGQLSAQNALARIVYSYGVGAPRDPEKALKYTRMAAAQNDPSTMYDLGAYTLNGEGVDKNVTEGLRLIRASADLGFADAQAAYGMMQVQGKLVPRDDEAGAKRVQAAAARGSVDGALYLAELYHDGRGVPKNVDLEIKWYLTAIDKGNSQAAINLGNDYGLGSNVPKDLNRAAALYKIASDKGNREGQRRYGLALILGEGVAKDQAAGVVLIQQAALADEPVAQTNLGKLYFFGQGLPKDYKLAASWFKKAAAQGETESIAVLKDPEFLATQK